MKMSFRIVTIGGFLLVLAVIVVAVFYPAIINRPTQTLIAHPYTEQQARGRVTFIPTAVTIATPSTFGRG